MEFKGKLWVILITTLFVSVLSACGNKEEASKSVNNTNNENLNEQNDSDEQNNNTKEAKETDEVVEIRYSWWGNVERHERYDQLMDIFEEHHPNIKVLREPASFDDYWDKIATQTAGGNPSDVLMFTRGQLPEYVSRDAVLPLDDYIEDGTIDMSEFTDTAIDLGKYEGKTYQVTKGMSAPSTFVNTDLLDRKEIPHPDYEMTWDEFTDYMYEIAPLLGENENGQQIYPINDPTASETAISTFMRQRGHELFSEDGTSLAFEKQDLHDWFKYWQDLREDGIVPPAEIWAEEGDLEWEQGPIAINRIVMELGRPSNNLINLQAGIEDEINLIRMPTNPEDVKYGELITGANLGISAHSEHPEAVAELINFWLNDLEFNKLYNNDHGIVGNQKLLEEMDIDETTQKVVDHLADVQDTVNAQTQRPPGQTEIFNQISRSHEEVYFGSTSIEDAVEDIFKVAEEVLN